VHGGAALAGIAKQIEDAVKPLGIAREDRPYAPHLTLARIKHENIRELREHIANMTNFDFGTFQVPEFHLYMSKTGPKGSVYTTLASYPLPAAHSQSGAATGSPE
jgi:2'-5' RNA ligase